ncbi:MAG: 2-amino-4-hydroxy-6-hydroxymethyldihydropteridine diphosphokinase [Proteobacteria bacterium]|nr:2-amino-4-hydroxy-6-hydroxymethyldihydropteridine diphosphokinase [Pseudomonadota bacterium]
MTTTKVYLGIGSNIDREINIRDGLEELKSRYGELQISPVYESKAFGFDGDNFYNLVIGFNTNFGVNELEIQLREIEYQFGRRQNETRYSSRTLDIDLLLYGDLVSENHHVPRVDIIEFGFVLKPLCDIEPDLIHPVTGETMRTLWKNFDGSKHPIDQIFQSFSL